MRKLFPKGVRHLAAVLRDAPRIPLATLAAALAQLRAPLPVLGETEGAIGSYTGVRGEHHFEMLARAEFSEEHFRQLTNALLKPGDVAIDVGANVGTHTVHLAQLVSNGHVYAFEPQSLTHAILRANIVRNKLRNVTTFPFAASDTTGNVLAMHLPVASTFNSGIAAVSDGGKLGDKTITYRIDDLDIPPTRFIKIDVQGSELRALQGAAALIARDTPILFVELEEQHLKALGTDTQQVMEHLLGLDYVLFRVLTDYPCDHVCVPASEVDDFEAHILPKLAFETQKIAGRRVALRFEGRKPQNYADVSVIA
ncbi:FkbM family methyltransferase [uncultured Tateyamaria sp.]|uniref:FkbM family methyltransferase n=1 Tax=Tateyamaria sp. 1078 TaxID=3417464 RepID=UPI00260D9A64|nr:FkbM family methyltransferase [uncultured Tateyamaria sp.]